jgi:NodT family efflux transporter outer membrane factor (OMF) lipoprotein
VANENTLAARGALFPTVGASFAPTRQHIAATLASPASAGQLVYNLYTAQLSIGYVADVFGATRRQIESTAAQAEAQRFQREAVYLTLTSNVVAAAIQEASLRAQLAATHEIIASATRLTDLTRKQQSAGQISTADVAAQETALAQAQASLPPLEKQLEQQRDLLAVLVGRFPGEGLAQKFELESLTLPEELPVSLPSRLVEQRPDVRAAEAQLHAASAQVGVAIANRLPNITLSAGAGSAALELSQLFSSSTNFWSIAGGVAQPIFEGGTLMHRQRAAEAQYEQAAAQYRSTVLTAFQNVADVLNALQSDARALAATDAAERSARKSLGIARRQWEAGAIGLLPVLNAQQAYQQSVVAVAQARAARYTDTAALFQALGGGWWNRDERNP